MSRRRLMRPALPERVPAIASMDIRKLDKIRGAPVEARRPRMTTTLKLRGDALRVLHLKQINVLRRWRSLRQEERYEEADLILPELLLTVNAIASGLRTTG